MVRLVLGLLLACGLLYGAYRSLRVGPAPTAAQQSAARREGVAVPAKNPARAIVDDLQKIETTNRAALDHASQSAEGR